MCKDKNQGRGKKRWLKMGRKKPNQQQLGSGRGGDAFDLDAVCICSISYRHGEACAKRGPFSNTDQWTWPQSPDSSMLALTDP